MSVGMRVVSMSRWHCITKSRAAVENNLEYILRYRSCLCNWEFYRPPNHCFRHLHRATQTVSNGHRHLHRLWATPSWSNCKRPRLSVSGGGKHEMTGGLEDVDTGMCASPRIFGNRSQEDTAWLGVRVRPLAPGRDAKAVDVEEHLTSAALRTRLRTCKTRMTSTRMSTTPHHPSPCKTKKHCIHKRWGFCKQIFWNSHFKETSCNSSNSSYCSYYYDTY